MSRAVLRRSGAAAAAVVAAVAGQPSPALASWGEENWGEMLWGGSASVPLLPFSGWLLLVGLLLGVAVLARQRRGLRAFAALLLAGLIVPAAAYAATVVLPNIFANGTVADAVEVNENFLTLVLESNAQNTRIAALEAGGGGDVTGVAFASGSASVTLPTDNSETVVRSVAIDPPAPGWVIVSTSGDFFKTGLTIASVNCGISDTTAIDASHIFTALWSFNVDPGSLGQPYSSSRVFAVDGTPVTYNLVCRSVAGFDVNSDSMHALYVPNQY